MTTPTTPSSTTPERLRQVIAETSQFDVQELRQRVGPIVVTTSDDPVYAELLTRVYPTGEVMALYDRGDVERDPATVFFADRIPAGIEAQVILREFVQLHGWDAKPDDWALLLKGAESWDTWGGTEGAIYKAVSARIEQSQRYTLPSMDKVRVVFTLQEAVKRRVEPDASGRGVSGWLHTAFDTVRETVRDLVGCDVGGYEAADLVKLLQIGSPFGREVEAMRAVTRSLARREMLLSSRAMRMAELDAQFQASGEAPAASSREEALSQRLAELTERQASAEESIESFGVSRITTMRSALWEIKGLVGSEPVVPSFRLEELESLAYAGLSTGTGSLGERAALKSILFSVQQAADMDVGLESQVVMDAIAKGVPFLVEGASELGTEFRVLGAHPNRNFFDIRVKAKDGLSAFGAAALMLQEAGEEGDAEFFAAIPAGTAFELPGDSVVALETVLDPEQADVFGLASADEVEDDGLTP